MKRYRYLSLYAELGMGVYLQSTDVDCLQALADQLRELMPHSGFYLSESHRLPSAADSGMIRSGELYDLRLHKLDRRDLDVAWWAMKQLGDAGWEPFAVTGSARDDALGPIHLRREITERARPPSSRLSENPCL